MICGLENIGNTCYLNCILQLLLRCDEFIDTVERAEMESDIIKNFQEFVRDYKLYQSRSIRPISIRKILDEKKLFQEYCQYDAHEFLIQFLDIIGEETKKISGDDMNKDYFHFHYYTYFQNVHQPHDRKALSHHEVILTLPHSETLQQSLDKFETRSIIEDWESELFKTKFPAETYNSIHTWSPYLFIQVNRYQSNFQKIQDKMEIPLEWKTSNNQIYTLLGAVIHHGVYQFGHYICILRLKDSYVLCDDDRIRTMPEKDALEHFKMAYLLLYAKN